MLSTKKNNIDGDIDTLLMLAITYMFLVHMLAAWVRRKKQQTHFQESLSNKPPLLSVHV